MADILDPARRSALMARIRSKGNASTELALVQLLRRHRITGWRRNSKLPGKPDLVFPKNKLAVFVDGDFWHGHPTKAKIPATNQEFWKKKIEGNRMRDRKVGRQLAARGWAVLRIWESSLAADPTRQAKRIEALLNHPDEIRSRPDAVHPDRHRSHSSRPSRRRF